jgi:hypothetical protein
VWQLYLLEYNLRRGIRSLLETRCRFACALAGTHHPKIARRDKAGGSVGVTTHRNPRHIAGSVLVLAFVATNLPIGRQQRAKAFDLRLAKLGHFGVEGLERTAPLGDGSVPVQIGEAGAIYCVVGEQTAMIRPGEPSMCSSAQSFTVPIFLQICHLLLIKSTLGRLG